MQSIAFQVPRKSQKIQLKARTIQFTNRFVKFPQDPAPIVVSTTMIIISVHRLLLQFLDAKKHNSTRTNHTLDPINGSTE